MALAAVFGVIGVTLPLSVIGVFFAEISTSYLKLRKAAEEEQEQDPEKLALMAKENALREQIRSAVGKIAEQFPEFNVDAGSVTISARDKPDGSVNAMEPTVTRLGEDELENSGL